MTVKKQVIVLSVVYNEEETHANSAAAAISHRLFNEDGIIEWDFVVKKEELLSADITDDDLDEITKQVKENEKIPKKRTVTIEPVRRKGLI